MRNRRQPDRLELGTLKFLSHSDDASLSAMAEHLGLSLPAASRMAELLVRRGLMKRRHQPHDRRRVSLSLTRRGREVFKVAFAATRTAVARRLKTLARRELDGIVVAMRTLNRVFAPENCELEPRK